MSLMCSAAASWAPTLSDLYAALCETGYRGAHALGAQSGKASRRSSATAHAAQAVQGSSGGAQGEGAAASVHWEPGQQVRQLRAMQAVLQLLAGLCALHKQRAAGALDFSREQQARH